MFGNEFHRTLVKWLLQALGAMLAVAFLCGVTAAFPTAREPVKKQLSQSVDVAQIQKKSAQTMQWIKGEAQKKWGK